VGEFFALEDQPENGFLSVHPAYRDQAAPRQHVEDTFAAQDQSWGEEYAEIPSTPLAELEGDYPQIPGPVGAPSPAPTYMDIFGDNVNDVRRYMFAAEHFLPPRERETGTPEPSAMEVFGNNEENVRSYINAAANEVWLMDVS
jgi:hypothetical protein